eukprot:2293292-Pyramimonas_sp.AAC.1
MPAETHTILVQIDVWPKTNATSIIIRLVPHASATLNAKRPVPRLAEPVPNLPIGSGPKGPHEPVPMLQSSVLSKLWLAIPWARAQSHAHACATLHCKGARLKEPRSLAGP